MANKKLVSSYIISKGCPSTKVSSFSSINLIHLSYKTPPYHASITFSYDNFFIFIQKWKIFLFLFSIPSTFYPNPHGLYQMSFSSFLYTFWFCISLYTYFAYFHSLKSFSLVQNACFLYILEKL